MCNAEDAKILDEVLEDFTALAAIPRPSLHEKAISDYLLGVFRRMGCEVVQDEANNIIADLAPAPGFEQTSLPA